MVKVAIPIPKILRREISIESVLKKLRQNHPKANLKLVREAFAYANLAHKNQRREGGDPYIIHPLNTALIIADLGLRDKAIAAALLHDTVEDSKAGHKEIKKKFGLEIANLVEGVTKLSQIKYSEDVQRIENLRKMILAMARDIRVILIKLADRLNNMQTLASKKNPEDRKRIALETIEVYAPIAHRLGMGEFKGQLEDLAFPYAKPKQYKWLVEKSRDVLSKQEKSISRVKRELLKILRKGNIKVLEAHGRKKHLYSLWLKLKRRHMDFSQIYDLVALRVIVPEVKDCYGALGLIHEKWKPLPGRIKDYIATPKPNGYQSLHTTVIATNGKIIEIQIRTSKMHEEAEYGVAASWAYHEQKGFIERFIRNRFAKNKELEREWVKQLSSWQKEVTNPEEFMQLLKIDFFKDRIFVFTPRGDVLDLPRGATPIDYAYQIHTDLGHKCQGSRINGKMSKLDTPLRNGDVVDVIKNEKSTGPSRDWLRFVKTSTAKSKIRGWFRKIDQDEKFEAGQKILDQHLRELHNTSLEKIPGSRLAKANNRLGYRSTTDIFVNLSEGVVSPERVVNLLFTPQELLPQTERRHQIAYKAEPILKSLDNQGLLINTAKCCNPKPGDAIVGAVTQGRGIIVHKKDCTNIGKIKNQDRLVEVSWLKSSAEETHPVTITVRGQDRPGLSSEIAETLAKFKIDIDRSEVLAGPEGTSVINFDLEIKDLRQLSQIFNKIRGISDVLAVSRKRD